MATRAKISASLLLLRRAANNEFEVLMTQRRAQMTYSNSYVFPGGTVDAGDKLAKWKAVLPAAESEHLPETSMTASVDLSELKLAAIRETYEEVGVFLGKGVPAAGEKVTFLQRCVNPDSSIKATPGLDTLHYFMRFVTGIDFKVRFDTTFFAAETCSSSSVELSTSESKAFRWVTPLQALNLFESRLMKMYPPQLYVLYVLSHIAGLETLFPLCKDSLRQPIIPSFRYNEGSTGVSAMMPGDHQYPHPIPWTAVGKHRVILDLIEGLSFDVSPGISHFLDQSPYKVLKKGNSWQRVPKSS